MEQIKKCVTCEKIFQKKITCSKKDWDLSKFCSRSCINLGRVSFFKGKKDRWSNEQKEKMSKRMIKTMTPEHKEHLSKILKGKTCNTGRTHIKKGQHLSPSTEFGKIPPWNKGKKNPYFAGQNNPRWKGGIYPEHLKIRHSQEMKQWRLEIFKKDNYTCVLCKRKRKEGDRVVLHADHIKPFSKHSDLRLSLKNGRTLCAECHRKTETYGKNL